jgi:hypothetical protein
LAGVLLLCLLSSVPTAVAAAPANDDFANAQVVGPLPVNLTESNGEATKEEGEPYHGPLGSKGHSVWFEWEAASSSFVTVGTCGSDFRAVASVYSGTQVDALTKVAGDFHSEGPGCPGFTGQEVTFKAIAGTTYEIAVDGDAFYVPPGEPPVGEGTFDLQVETTPPPANDDFANAQVLTGSIEEEEGAGFASYWANARGYNWQATTEAGEPSYGAGSGASTWYAWTAPQSGKYRFSGPCCVAGLNWSLYTGGSLGELTQVLAATGFAEVTVTAGTTYRIGVYGTPDLATEEPSMGSFFFSISAQLPPLSPPPAFGGNAPGLPPPDTTPPETQVFKRVLKRQPPIWIFSFHSSEAGSTFRCRLDKHRFATCPSSERYGSLNPGHHTLRVFAVDAAGNRDTTPAIVRFRVRRSKALAFRAARLARYPAQVDDSSSHRHFQLDDLGVARPKR